MALNVLVRAGITVVLTSVEGGSGEREHTARAGSITAKWLACDRDARVEFAPFSISFFSFGKYRRSGYKG